MALAAGTHITFGVPVTQSSDIQQRLAQAFADWPNRSWKIQTSTDSVVLLTFEGDIPALMTAQQREDVASVRAYICWRLNSMGVPVDENKAQVTIVTGKVDDTGTKTDTGTKDTGTTTGHINIFGVDVPTPLLIGGGIIAALWAFGSGNKRRG